MFEKLNRLLTAVIPVKNEEKNLPECLDSVKKLEHVVIVDSGSTDSTCEIADRYGREVVQFKWDGHFPKKRNWILRNYLFKTPWIMFLDADERPGELFWKELTNILPCTSHDVFFISLNNWFMGKLLRHGDTPRKTAIVRLGKGEYERIEEESWSQLDMEIHEHIVTNGTIGYINTPIDHFDMRSLSSYYAKHNQYSDWEAGRYEMLSRSHSDMLTFRQKIKYRFLTCCLLPYAYFFYTYFVKLGFLDGVSGYYFAINKFSMFNQVQSKVLERRLLGKSN